MALSGAAKPFRIFGLSMFHHLSSIKIGTDAVLISAAVRRYVVATHVLDVGCGCGIIGLSFINKNKDAHLTGIDIHQPSVMQAADNAALNQLSGRSTFFCADYLYLKEENKFDLIVSNPPYFRNQLKSPKEAKNNARHNDLSIPYEALFKKSAELCTGIVAVILPDEYRELAITLAEFNTLGCVRQIEIFSKPDSQNPIRVILFFQNTPKNIVIQNQKLVIRNADNAFTSEYLDFVYQS